MKSPRIVNPQPEDAHTTTHHAGEPQRSDRGDGPPPGQRSAIVLAALIVWGSTAFGAYQWGRAAEAELTLDGYERAEYATELLRTYLPIGEAALRECRAVQAMIE